MARFVISSAAASDLEEIDEFTRAEFGLEQAARLRRRFRRVLGTLVHAPNSAPRRAEYDPPGKAFRYCLAVLSFVIVYEPGDDGIRVARVLHGARNLASELGRRPGDNR